MSLDICCLELSDDLSYGFKNEFESSTENEPSVFELLKFYC